MNIILRKLYANIQYKTSFSSLISLFHTVRWNFVFTYWCRKSKIADNIFDHRTYIQISARMHRMTIIIWWEQTATKSASSTRPIDFVLCAVPFFVCALRFFFLSFFCSCDHAFSTVNIIIEFAILKMPQLVKIVPWANDVIDERKKNKVDYFWRKKKIMKMNTKRIGTLWR